MIYKQRASSAGLLLTKSQADETSKRGLKLGELSKGAKDYILQSFALHKCGIERIDKDFKQTLKGRMCESKAVALLDQVYPVDDFRVLNKKRLYSKEFTGEPDLILYFLKKITDIKCPYNFLTYLMCPRNFEELQKSKWEYYMQLLVYRELLRVLGFEMNTLSVCFCAIDTPIDILERFEYKSLSYQFGYDTDEYHEAIEQLINLHTFTDKLSPSQRIIRIEWEFDAQCERDTLKLKSQIEVAREYYNSLSLPNI